jgi:hypothetical protein
MRPPRLAATGYDAGGRWPGILESSVLPNTQGSDALNIMNSHRVGSLVVTDQSRVLGIVTRRDLERAGLPVRDDARGHCSCCGSLGHLREHPTGALCTDCLDRSRMSQSEADLGGGD